MPICRLFIIMANPQNSFFAKTPADNLQANRQAAIKTAWRGNRGQAGQRSG